MKARTISLAGRTYLIDDEVVEDHSEQGLLESVAVQRSFYVDGQKVSKKEFTEELHKEAEFLEMMLRHLA